MQDRITDPLVRMTLEKKQALNRHQAQLDRLNAKHAANPIGFADRANVLPSTQEEYDYLKALLTPEQEQVVVDEILSQEADTRQLLSDIRAYSGTNKSLFQMMQSMGSKSSGVLDAAREQLTANNNNNKV